MSRINFCFVDLFAGCGGLSLGLEQAGFSPIFVNELAGDAMDTYLRNRLEEYPWLEKNNVRDVKNLVHTQLFWIISSLASRKSSVLQILIC